MGENTKAPISANKGSISQVLILPIISMLVNILAEIGGSGLGRLVYGQNKKTALSGLFMVAEGGIEPPTSGL